MEARVLHNKLSIGAATVILALFSLQTASAGEGPPPAYDIDVNFDLDIDEVSIAYDHNAKVDVLCLDMGEDETDDLAALGDICITPGVGKIKFNNALELLQVTKVTGPIPLILDDDVFLYVGAFSDQVPSELTTSTKVNCVGVFMEEGFYAGLDEDDFLVYTNCPSVLDEWSPFEIIPL